jgi:hypothetical protein
MSRGFWTDGDVSMEGATLLYKAIGEDRYRKILYTHLSDDKKQDASAIRCNLEHVLNDLDGRMEMPRELLEAMYGILDGCASQHCCGVVFYTMAMISYSMRLHYTRCVQAPGHGKEEVDGLIGTEKTYADSIFAQMGRQAKEDAQEHDIKAPIHRMVNGMKTSLAKMLYDILSNPKWKFRQKEDDQKVKEQWYHFRPVDNASSHNVKMKAVGFKKGGGCNVIGSHYCFIWLICCLACA